MLSAKERLLCAAYLLLGLILLLGNTEQRLMKANLLSISLYYPFVNSVSKLEEMFYLREKNRRFAELNAEQLIRMTALENELQRIRKFIHLEQEGLFLSDAVDGFTIASVVSYRGSFTNRILIIDKGSLHGVSLSNPVISDRGIVGKVISVSPNHALVLPLNNPLFKVGVVNSRTNVQGLLEADITGSVYMNMIRAGSQISIGDTVSTSSVSTVFPRGYPVGTVSRLQKRPEDVYLRALINPFAIVSDLEQVTVLFFSKNIPEVIE